MTSMSRASSASSFQGFSVYQPALGAPLQFLPAVGTKELEQLIDAYLPGSASAPEKRASISMDFFDHSGQTGENFKYYAVYTPVTTPDSAQSSSFSTSPIMSDMSSYSSPSQASIHAASGVAKKAHVATRKPATKQEKIDFSDLPGMKILTKDGTDVTNSVSRGCKSKEQRDHAHLMRILKACDACKKKKIRCDPSHKKRAASQMESESRSEAAKPVKKTKKTTSTPAAELTNSKPASAESSFQMDDIGLDVDLSTPLDESWEQFLTFTDEPVVAAVPQNFYDAIPHDFDFFFGAENNNFSPSASGSSVSPIQPVTPVSSGMVPHVDNFTTFGHDETLAFLQSEHNNLEPSLPYLNSAGQHGSNYVDFNLFSPSSSFIDEEPKLLKSGDKRNASGSSVQSAGSQLTPVLSTGLLGDQEWRFDQSHLNLSPGEPEWRVPGDQVSTRQIATGDGEVGFYGSSLPYHANDAGQDTSRSVQAVTRTQDLQSMRRNSPVAIVAQNGESLLGSNDLSCFTAAVSSAPLLSQVVIPQASRRNIVPESIANAHLSSQTVSTTVRPPCPPSVLEASMLTSQKELQALDSDRHRPGRSTTRAILPLSATSTDAAASSRSDNLGQLSLPLGQATGGLQGLNNPLEVGSSSRPSQTLFAGNALNRAAQGLHYGTGSDNANAALPVHGLESSQGLLRPAANMPLRLLEMILAGGALLPTLPVRQLPTSSPVCSQLVVFGLVSLLMVVVMSILPMQTQTPILANLPITPVILLSLLSTVSAYQHLQANPSGGAIGDSIRSKPNSTVSTCRRSRSPWTSFIARVPVLSCV